MGESNTLLTSLSLVTGSQSPHDVSLAVGLEGESMDLVPPDDSVECSGQIESRGSVTGSEEPRISESMLQCVSGGFLCLYTCTHMFVCVCEWGWVSGWVCKRMEKT